MFIFIFIKFIYILKIIILCMLISFLFYIWFYLSNIFELKSFVSSMYAVIYFLNKTFSLFLLLFETKNYVRYHFIIALALLLCKLYYLI